MSKVTPCRECERTLLDILETVNFDLGTGCWVGTDRTPLFSTCRIYLAYICGTYDTDPDFSKLHPCVYTENCLGECRNPDHLRPDTYAERVS